MQTTLYRLERAIGEHVKFVGLVNEAGGQESTYEYWVEIDGQKMYSSTGYAKTREEFEKRMEKSAVDFFTEVIGEVAPLIVKDR